jgi:tetratricopeptide (TPR) repeat protein
MAVRWPEDADAHYLLGDGYRALDARLPELPPEQVTKKAKRHRLREYEKKTREEREALRRANPTLDPVLKENQARSEEAYREALRLEADHAGALRGLGYLLEEANRLVEAGYYLREYLRVAPGSSDRAVVVRHLSEITEALRTTPPAEESQG